MIGICFLWSLLGLGVSAVFLCTQAASAAPSLLTILQIEPPRSLDPADHTATFTSAMLDPIYEGLVGLDARNHIMPLLAVSWTHDPAGLLWSFRLRQGVHFQDGSALDSAAVVASFERLLSTRRGLAGSSRFVELIVTVDAPAPDQVKFQLRRPSAYFLQLLATEQASIVSPRADAAGTLASRPVGTGPYRFVAEKPGDYVLEQKYPLYWGVPASIDRLKWTWSPEVSVLAMAIRAGDADIVNPFAPVFAASIADDPALRLIRKPGAALYWVALNTRLAPFDDVRVRRALSLATDRRGLVQALLMGMGTPAAGPLPASMPDHDPAGPAPAADPDGARALLAEAGYRLPIAMSVAVQEPEEPIAEALQAMWAKAGFELRIRRLESGVWTQAAFASPLQKQRDRLDATIASWSAGQVPDLLLRPLFATASAAPAGANLGFFSDPALDRLLDHASAALDDDARRLLYDQAIAEIQRTAPGVMLFVRDDLVATRRGVTGLRIRPGGEIIVAHARLDPAP